MGEQEHQYRLNELVAGSDDESVKAALSTARGLRSFLQSVDKLDADQLTSIVEQAIVLIEGFYVHLPFKRAMHGIDPVRRLRLLHQKVKLLPSEMSFHKEMTEIFTSLRDLHTNYVLPLYFARMVAFLPFRIEAWHDPNGQAHYVVSTVGKGFTHPTFCPGAEVTYYNGIPIERAVEIAADHHAGSNPAARWARGVAGLTVRAMSIAPPPDEEWAVIGYIALDGSEAEIRLDWTISSLPSELEHQPPAANAEIASAIGLDLEGDTVRRVERMLFSPEKITASRNLADRRAAVKRATANRSQYEAEAENVSVAAAAVTGTESMMPLVFTARPVLASGRQAAYVRIHTFMVDDDTEFVNEFIRLIGLPAMPQDGLIIDVRGNGGGLIWAGERLLQLLSPRTIEPCRAQFISTQQNLALCRGVGSLRQWAPSLERALSTGSPYSAAYPITPADKCNDIGQRYFGPVVLITDARCYSTTDIFAAGFRDHRIGKILGVDDNLGAGGANVWTLDQIANYFAGANVPSPVQTLPNGAGMRVAIRRMLRVGAEAGTEIEDLGIVPDATHPMTRADVLNGNTDLIAKAVEMLPVSTRRFDLSPTSAGNMLTLTLTTGEVDYVEVFVDGRAQSSHDVIGNAVTIQVQFSPQSRVDLRGYRNTGELICMRRWSQA